MAPGTAAPARHDGFDRMPIAGTWRPGSSEKTATDTDPCTRRAAQVMADRKDEIVDWHIRESGAAAPAAEFEWAITQRDFFEAASYPYRVEGRILPADGEGKGSRVYRRPVGVVAVISPWNVPMHLSNRSVTPALALGNAVVLKPAGDTPVTGGLLLAKVYEEAGLPEGLLSVVVGSGSEIGDAIVEHPAPRVVSFTGSTPVRKGIAQKAGLKKLSLELGGNGPLVVVLDDADLGYAVDAAVFGEVLPPVGPVVNAKQPASIQDKVAQAREDGARQVLGGDPTGPIGPGWAASAASGRSRSSPPTPGSASSTPAAGSPSDGGRRRDQPG